MLLEAGAEITAPASFCAGSEGSPEVYISICLEERRADMNFFTAVHSDAGSRKKKNQDSVLLMEAETKQGGILFAAVCDGMGGLSRGETASAAMVNAFAKWFERGMPYLARSFQTGTFCRERLWKQWTRLINHTSSCIEAFGRSNHISLGTTAAGLLMWIQRERGYFSLQQAFLLN